MKFLKTTLFLSFVFALAPLIALAAPGIPHQFYGLVNFTNGPAADGLLVEARVNNVVVGSANTSGGKYGYMPSLLFAAKSDGDWNEEIVEFYVGGIKATTPATVTLTKGGYTNLDLTIPGSVGTITKEADDVITNETVAITPTTPTVINMGTSLNINMVSTASATTTIEKVEKLQSSFFSGATAIMSGKNLLNGYEIKIKGTGLSITVTMKYDDTGIDESTVKPYKFDGTNWVEIPFITRDTTANTLTFTISAAQTPYVVFGQPPASTPTTVSSGGGGGGGSYIPPATSPLSAEAQKVDANKDGKIDVLDFNTLMVNWGKTTANNIADFNGDGKVDVFDFNLLMINWTL